MCILHIFHSLRSTDTFHSSKMVLFPAKKGEAIVIKTWTPEDYAREEKASKKQKTPWQERGPSIPSSCGGLWRNQQCRPRPGQEGLRAHQVAHVSQQPLEFELLHCPGCGNHYSSCGSVQCWCDTLYERLPDVVGQPEFGDLGRNGWSDSVACPSLYKWTVEQ